LNVQTDDSDIESNYMNITFNEAIEISGMKNEKPDTFILSNASIGWKASKGSGSWTPNDVTMKLMTRVDPEDLGLNATGIIFKQQFLRNGIERIFVKDANLYMIRF